MIARTSEGIPMRLLPADVVEASIAGDLTNRPVSGEWLFRPNGLQIICNRGDVFTTFDMGLVC